jgi:hypothetical protein
MTLLAVLVFIVLAAIGALHVAWGFGVRWPVDNERDLVALVIGARGRTTMPSLPQCLIAGAGVVACIVFAGRGIAAYVPAWRDVFLQEPFATMDRAWYGPLCLLLAVAFALLVVQR